MRSRAPGASRVGAVAWIGAGGREGPALRPAVRWFARLQLLAQAQPTHAFRRSEAVARASSQKRWNTEWQGTSVERFAGAQEAIELGDRANLICGYAANDVSGPSSPGVIEAGGGDQFFKARSVF